MGVRFPPPAFDEARQNPRLLRHPSLDDRFDPAIRIVDYDPAWPALAEAEVRAIEEVLGEIAVRVEHVGSTAVPGLAAKPILDLQLSVDALEPAGRYAEPLKRLGYVFVPTDDVAGLPPVTPSRRSVRARTTCMSARPGAEHELRHLAVRDFLRAHPDEAARYAALKRDVVARHPQDRLAYIEGKEEYVTALERRAVAWAGPSGRARRRPQRVVGRQLVRVVRQQLAEQRAELEEVGARDHRRRCPCSTRANASAPQGRMLVSHRRTLAGSGSSPGMPRSDIRR